MVCVSCILEKQAGNHTTAIFHGVTRLHSCNKREGGICVRTRGVGARGYFRSHSVRVLGAGLMVGGRGQCRVAAAHPSAGCMLAKFFIAISQGIFVGTRGLGGCGAAVVEGQCRVATAYVSAGCMLAKFFITISHCPWRDFISLSNGDKETKQRKRLSTIYFKCPQRADHCFWFPRSTVLARTTLR
jgi:hypothetical protein